MSLPSDDLLWEMALLISNQGKPCYHTDIHYVSEAPNISKLKPSLLKIKRILPHVKFYIHKICSFIDERPVTSFMFLMYRYPFQKEIYKLRYTNLPINRNLFDWSVSGLLFGYSPEEIQKKYDENKEKFGEIFA